jgi:sphingomyelin phosphodiesterase acid-like 3
LLEQLAVVLGLTPNSIEYLEFSTRGFARRDVANTSLSIILLNTLIYSIDHTPDSSNITDPIFQFQWLNATLSNLQAENRKAYILGHIPPGIDTYTFGYMWFEHYTTQYIEILSRYNGVVLAQWFGHTHKHSMKVMEGVDAPLFIGGAVTPIYLTNPS